MEGTAAWTDRFIQLSALDPDHRRQLEAQAQVLKVPKGAHVFSPGDTPQGMMVLLSGTVRVQQLSESGREIVLYRISNGESCVLTTTCLLAHDEYMAEGIAETDLVAVAIPKATFEALVAQSSVFRDFVFSGYANRIVELFLVINEIAFSRVDVRLARKLCELAGSSTQLAVTQQQLAAELGSAREVVSRQLQEFKRRGWIETSRGEVTLTNLEALQRLAAMT